MKYILSQPELAAVVKDFIADKDNEFGLNAVGKPTGFTQKQQAVLTVKLLTEAVFTDFTPKQFGDALRIVYDLANGSAARQVMEKAGLLAESGGKRGASIDALVSKYGGE